MSALATLLGVVLSACGDDSTWGSRPPVPQPPTRVIGGVPVAVLSENVPDLTEADVAYLVERAARETEGQRVRRIVHGRTHPIEARYIELQLEHHETRARVRRSRFIMVYWYEGEEGDIRGGTWEPFSMLRAEICAPDRSFLDEVPVPHAAIVDIMVGGDLTADEIVDVVDAAYDDVPKGQKLMSIHRKDGFFKIKTVGATRLRSLSGSVLEVRRGYWGWKVTLTGEWVA